MTQKRKAAGERLHPLAPASDTNQRQPTTTENDVIRLALRPKEAAKALGIGERLLWSMTNRGEIPHLRIGRAIVYPIILLNEYFEKCAKGGQNK